MRFAVEPEFGKRVAIRPATEIDVNAPSLLRDGSNARPILHPSFQAAKETILAELFNGQTLIVVAGAAGIGKTILLDEVGRILRSSGWNVEVGLESHRLVARSDDPKPQGSVPTAVLIDGPGRIAPVQMQRILGAKDVAIVMALPADADLRFPSSAPIRLPALTAGESAYYLSAWLSQAGHRPELVSGDVLLRIIGLSRGIPRVLSSILAELVGRASSQPSAEVSMTDVDDAASRMGVLDSAVPFEPVAPRLTTGAAVAIDAGAVQGPAQARESFQAGGFRNFDRSGFANGALAGLLGGVGLVLLGLLLFDGLPSSSDQADAGGQGGTSAAVVAHRSTSSTVLPTPPPRDAMPGRIGIELDQKDPITGR